MNAYASQKSMLWNKVYPEFAGSTDHAIRNIINDATQV
ncbi:hypothetical protein MNBD_GAMMA14-2154, partial [hydrothermal vent metagenome]